MARKTELLELLRASDEYVSGQEICEKFGVSRTAVWKMVKQLESQGYKIDAVQNKGYRLVFAPETLSDAEISSRLTTKWAGRNLVFNKETGSTNSDASHLGGDHAPEGTLVVADSQTAGRGRRGRSWESPAGSSVYMSLLLRPDIHTQRASMLTILMAMAVARAVQTQLRTQSQSQLSVTIKWPNDILMNKKKICGILTEMNLEGSDIQYVVIGVGINVNQESFPADITQTATSLRIETGNVQNRSALIADIMQEFESLYQDFTKHEDLSEFKDAYEAILVNLNQEVRVLDPKGEYTGTALGINNKGELLVRKQDGTTVEVYAGEVSVRGVYGYV